MTAVKVATSVTTASAVTILVVLVAVKKAKPAVANPAEFAADAAQCRRGDFGGKAGGQSGRRLMSQRHGNRGAG